MGQIKGTFFLHTVKALRAMGDAAEGVVPRDLRRYLRERILPSSWYPEEDHLGLLRALILISPPSGGDPWEDFGSVSAEREMTSTYKPLLRSGDPDSTFAKLRSVWPLVHDTGILEPALVEPGRGTIELREFALVDPNFCRLNTGFFSTVLRLAEAHDVSCRHTRCRAFGEEVCEWTASWKA